MKHILLDLLVRSEPSRAAINNCVTIINRDYLRCPPEQASHDELLVRGRNAALETAQDLESALIASRLSRLDHAELMGMLQKLLRETTRLKSGSIISGDCAIDAYHSGTQDMCEQLRFMLLEHETSRTLRALRHT